MLSGYWTLIPYAILFFGVLIALFADWAGLSSRLAALFGAACALVAGLGFTLSEASQLLFGGRFMLSVSGRLVSVGLCIITALWLMWIADRVKGRTREATALALLSVMGACMLVGAREFITLLVALELTAMPSYVLLGYWAHRRRSLESAMKYFLFSVLTTLVMTYGVSLVYAASGTTMIVGADVSGGGLIGLIGLVMLMVGIFAKVSAVPFHFWAPDAYAGASAWGVAFVATVPKAAAMVTLLRLPALMADTLPESLITVFVIIGIMSMVVGSFAALTQDTIRRIMAYSGVVNVGFLLTGIAALQTAGSFAIFAGVLFILFYVLAVFGVLLVTATEGDRVSDLAGLSERRPVAAWILVLLSLSLIGVPPLAGFFGKLYIFTSALTSSYVYMVVIAVLCSVVSAFYYLRFMKAAFFDAVPSKDGARTGEEIAGNGAVSEGLDEYDTKHRLFARTALVVATTLIVVLGPLSGYLIDWMMAGI
ncbi:MAG: NADH-quinone oxidoreductase subunit N [Coriobacteriia bacterium]|nr:NADH-quinone oxidoreductase subunit N [Coriobacteriia bacterium]